MAGISRRGFIRAMAGGGVGLTAMGGYAVGLEPGFLIDRTIYRMTPPGWTPGLRLRIGVIADIHACEPWMPAARVRDICLRVNAMNADVIVLLGDYTGGHMMVSGPVMEEAWGEALSVLRAPLGVHAILGNHDLAHGALPNMPADNGDRVREALRAAGVSVLENEALRIVKDGHAFWLAGLGDQLIPTRRRSGLYGRDDMAGTLEQVTDTAPVILLAHEPYIFPRIPERISLTLSGHTHGGQFRLPHFAKPAMPEKMRWSQTAGLVEAGERKMIISAGLGNSFAPVRFLRPPEIVEVDLGGPLMPV